MFFINKRSNFEKKTHELNYRIIVTELEIKMNKKDPKRKCVIDISINPLHWRPSRLQSSRAPYQRRSSAKD